MGLGGATLLAMYDYGGYNNACFFAGEIKRPEYVIPRSILMSILVGRNFISDDECFDHWGYSVAGSDAFDFHRVGPDATSLWLHGRER